MDSYGNGGLVVGAVISGRFRVDDILGAGGMGVVVAATHLELGYRVAIKFMRDELVARPDIVERFLREARAVVRLGTEHVCKVLDVARLESGAPYIVMEYLQGSDLAHAVLRQPLPVSIAVDYVLQACIALGEAHQAGIIHRDLKPANMFVTRRPDGGPLLKVLDFGIAKGLFETNAALTRTRMMMGSPGYMSPEQMESAKDVDARTDIWALGVSLYQLLTTRLPFEGRNATEIAVRIASEQPAPIDVDPVLRAILLRCLDKRPDARYPDVVSLAADLAPFGGPAGRHTATMVAQAANQPAPPSLMMSVPVVTPMPMAVTPMPMAMTPMPAGPPIGMTQLTAPPMTMTGGPIPVAPNPTAPVMGATPMTGPPMPATMHAAMIGAAHAPPSSVPASAPRKRSVVWYIVPLVAVAGIVIAIAVAANGHKQPSPGDAGVVAVARDAADVVAASDAPIVVVAATDAPVVVVTPPTDAGVVDAETVAVAGDAGTPSIIMPVDLTKLPKVPGMPTAAQLQQGLQMAASYCKQFLDGKSPIALPPEALFGCACMVRDAARAQAIVDKAPANKQAGMRSSCKQFGVTLK